MCEWKAIITLHCKNKVIIETRMSLVNKAEHYHKGRLKNISIYNPTVLVVSHVSHRNQFSKVAHFSLTK